MDCVITESKNNKHFDKDLGAPIFMAVAEEQYTL